MAKEKKDLKTIETNYEELEEQVREHRKSNMKLLFRILITIGLVVLVIKIVFALRSYDSYDITDSIERSASNVA